MKLLKMSEKKRITINRFKDQVFNESGDVISEEVKKKLQTFLDYFEKWIKNEPIDEGCCDMM